MQVEEVDLEVGLGDPAMIIHTSGTTGLPQVNKRLEGKDKCRDSMWIRYRTAGGSCQDHLHQWHHRFT